MKGMRRADDIFVCFGAKPNKGLSWRSSTWPEVGKGAQERSWKKELREGVAEERRRGVVDTGLQKRPVGMR